MVTVLCEGNNQDSTPSSNETKLRAGLRVASKPGGLLLLCPAPLFLIEIGHFAEAGGCAEQFPRSIPSTNSGAVNGVEMAACEIVSALQQSPLSAAA